MTSRIDDKTVVPLSIVALLFSVGISVTITASFWVRGVNDHLELMDKRFARVESRLGISEMPRRAPAETAMHLIPRAEAKGVGHGYASQER
jgi:hypothetical protein